MLALFEVLKVGRISLPAHRRASFGAVRPRGPEKAVECVPVGKHYGRRVGHFGLLQVGAGFLFLHSRENRSNPSFKADAASAACFLLFIQRAA